MEGLLVWLESQGDPPYSLMTHGEDLDGLVSAGIFWKLLEKVINLKFSAPYWAIDDKKKYDIVTDLPPPKGGCKLLFDHHPSNVELGRKRAIKSFVKPEYPSTALLVWELLSEESDLNQLKPLVDLTSEVDSGKYDEGSIRFTVVVRKLFSSPGRETSLRKVVEELIREAPSTGEELLRLKTILPVWKDIENEEKSFLSWINSLPKEIGNGKDLAVIIRVGRGPGYLSPLIHYKLQNLVDLEAVLRISDDGRGRLSIRSREGSRVSALELATKLSGGGHKRAAGATINPRDVELLEKILRKGGMEVRIIDKPH